MKHTTIACKYIGYIEKSAAAVKSHGYAALLPKEEYAGYDNMTRFAVDVGHPNGYPWCQTFVNACLAEAYGKDLANKLLCGKLSSASTMEVKDALVKAGREIALNDAMDGDLVFRSRTGGGHVGIVVGWEKSGIVTVEGNTSDMLEDWNGGKVCLHRGARWEWAIHPDWSILNGSDWHWLCVDGVWYYQDATGHNSYGWKLIGQGDDPSQKHWYYFDEAGRMQIGIVVVDGKRYFLQPTGPLEGALCITDADGALAPWYIND